MSEPFLPRYGHGTLADVMPSVLSALGVPGASDPLGIGRHGDDVTAAAVLLVDGLGAELLADHAADAPALTELGTDRGWHVDVDTTPALLTGVRRLAGEARVRHVYGAPGAADDVLAAWRSELGDRAWVCGRDEAVEAGWFGPTVSDVARGRIGEVVAAARDRWVLTRSRIEPRESALIGHHGSLTAAEQLVPLLVARG